MMTRQKKMDKLILQHGAEEIALLGHGADTVFFLILRPQIIYFLLAMRFQLMDAAPSNLKGIRGIFMFKEY